VSGSDLSALLVIANPRGDEPPCCTSEVARVDTHVSHIRTAIGARFADRGLSPLFGIALPGIMWVGAGWTLVCMARDWAGSE
jgi:hypothetical protein